MLIAGQDEVVKALVSKLTGINGFGPCATLAILEDDEFVGGALYSNYIESPDGEPVSIEVSLATLNKRWATKNNLRGLFSYPFIQLNVKRVQATTKAGADAVRSLLERLGFTFEGIGREAYPLGGDAAVYSMLRSECKWIENGKIIT